MTKPVPNGNSPAETNGTAPSQSPTQPPSSTSTLPPEALDLASRLFNYARSGDAQLTQYITAGIPPNLTNSEGDTLLMLASYHGHAPLVTALIQGGADVNALNGRGQSPLSGAVFKDHQDVVRALVEGGARADIGTPNSIQTAGMFGRRQCAEIMGVEWEACVGSIPEGILIGPHGNMG